MNARLGPRYYADVNARPVLEEVVIAAPHVVYPDVGIMGMPVREPAVAERPPVAAAIAPAPLRRMAVVWEEIRLRTVEVRQIGSDQLVTAIEILSPYNKRPGEGLDEYREKRRRINYHSLAPPPGLRPAMREWAAQHLPQIG